MIIIPSTVDKYLSWHVIVKKSKTNKLKNDLKIIPEQIRSVSQTRVVKKLGKLEANYLNEFEDKLAFLINQKSSFYHLQKLFH